MDKTTHTKFHPNVIDLTGQVFTRLTVRGRGKNKPYGKAAWNCDCTCGNIRNVLGTSLRSGNTKSCGCLKKEGMYTQFRTHGAAAGGKLTLEYRTWIGMLQRCANARCKSYRNYGGRGITVCGRWFKFENFLADMGECPPNHTLERINNDLGYSPENCRWATRREQGRNKRSNRLIAFNDQSYCLAKWAELIGINRETLQYRLNKWTIERALSEPVGRAPGNKKKR